MSRPSDVELVRIALLARGGVARWSALVCDVGERAVARAAATGAVVRHAPGIYALPDMDRNRLAAAGLRGVLSHGSAALAWGLDTLGTTPGAHVLVPANAMRRSVPPGISLHYGEITAEEWARGATSLARTLVDCARILPLAEALAVCDSALRRGLITAAQLTSIADAASGRGIVRARRILACADGAAANVFESGLRAIALEMGLTCLRPQVAVQTPYGMLHVDLGDECCRLALEAESFEFHGRRVQLVRDCGRTNGLVLADWRFLRFAWEHVMFSPGYVRGVIARVHGPRPCRPPKKLTASRRSGGTSR